MSLQIITLAHCDAVGRGHPRHQSFHEHKPVGQASQRIMMRHVLYLRLGALSVRHITAYSYGADDLPSSVAHRHLRRREPPLLSRRGDHELFDIKHRPPGGDDVLLIGEKLRCELKWMKIKICLANQRIWWKT